jgi:hypothetical protein
MGRSGLEPGGIWPMLPDISNIFMPSTGVDLMMNINSPTPIPRSTIIYDTDYGNKTLIIAQPFIPLTARTPYDQLHLTTIVSGRQRRFRVGVACHPLQFLNDYRLAGKSSAKAIVLQYTPPAIEINIRSAFRLSLGSNYLVKAKIMFQKSDFYSGTHFNIRDISLDGLGVLIPLKIKKETNPLTAISLNETVPIGMILIDKGRPDPVGAFAVKIQARRLNTTFTPTHMLAGFKIVRFTRENEMILNQFIHNAQIEELKRLSNLESD